MELGHSYSLSDGTGSLLFKRWNRNDRQHNFVYFLRKCRNTATYCEEEHLFCSPLEGRKPQKPLSAKLQKFNAL